MVWTAFSLPFLLVGLVSLGSLWPFLRLHADAGSEVSGRHASPDAVTAMRDRA
jgi:hypothetical protein